jgi:predicted TIM-barrel fold metal-dependent hydrolase
MVSPVTSTSTTPRAAGCVRAPLDAHVHVFDPARFPYVATRRYTPGCAVLDALIRHLDAVQCHGVVLVQPSVYGDDHGCLLDALARLGPRARGIAAFAPQCMAPQKLDALHAAGVRGIRLNFAVENDDDRSRARLALLAAASLVHREGWCVQVHGSPALLSTVEATLDTFQVPLVLDHFAGIRASTPLDDADVGTLCRLLATGRVYVKLSAFYRASSHPAYEDLEPLLRLLIACRPDRLVWGSDWPHTGGGSDRNPSHIEPFRRVDLAASIDLIARCTPDEAVLHAVLIGNATRLYGFTPLLERP